MSENLQDIIHDWNTEPTAVKRPLVVELHDETLRDGIQCPSVEDPDIESKKTILRGLSDLGIASADVGLPGAGQRAIDDVTVLAELARDEKLPIRMCAACRTHPNDIKPILKIAEKTGVPLEVMAFLGSSPIRMLAEAWEEDKLEKLTREAMRLSAGEGLPTSFVTEDTVRSSPETLKRLFVAAVEEGADRLVLCDTVGHATPQGVRNLVKWTHDLLVSMGVRDRVRVDWHGHNDRGLGLINAMVAIDEGCDRVHGTLLGVGERVGNTHLDLLLVNMKLQGLQVGDLSGLFDLCQLVSTACNVPIPINYPVFGLDAFRTGTGVHAAAVIKAERMGQPELADRIYSGVPAAWFGREQEICVGHQSGLSNVKHWMNRHGHGDDEGLAQAIFQAAKKVKRLLSDVELQTLVAAHRS